MTAQEHYQFIQIVMASLGLYDGKCEGAWGPKSIAAKREWELLSDFEPAVPNRGLPFTQGCKLPKGMRWVPGNSGKITVDFITDEEFAKLYKEHALLTTSQIEGTDSKPTTTSTTSTKKTTTTTVDTVSTSASNTSADVS